MKRGHVPFRTCMGCHARRPKPDLLRLVIGPGGVQVGDLEGRGFYVCKSVDCVDSAVNGRSMRRLMGRGISESEAADIRRRVSGQNDLDGGYCRHVISCSGTGGASVA